VSGSVWQREFLELLDSHGAVLMAMLRRLCGNRHDADDVFQDTALRVWRNLPNRPALRNAKAWVMTIGYRAFLDAHDRKRTYNNVLDPIDGKSNSPRQAAERAEEADRVRAAINALPDAIREVVALHYGAGLSIRETAHAMRLPEGTIKSRLHSAIHTLRSRLK
jgi:RNA polymerase sigma-70 factor, ECF subfamily